MAGIGVKLNRIFEKNTLTSDLIGLGYSAVITVAPMFLVIGNILLMGRVLGLAEAEYYPRELFSCTVLYIFIFSLLMTAPFNSVFSRYMADVIYEERYEDILPCFYVGLLLNVLLSCAVGIPFCIREAVVGQVNILYVFTGFCGFIASVLVFYAMLYLSVCKDYKKISFFFFTGMSVSFLFSLFLTYVLHMEVTDVMLISITVGFLFIACEEIAMIKRYFKKSSGNYRPVLRYFGKYWKLVIANFFYILGLFLHNFIFWTSDLQMTVADSFLCAPPYDMASCIAMFTNISMTVILITRIEMHFHDKYKGYSEAVIGGRGIDIKSAQNRMFRQLSAELMNLARIQFIISVILFLLCVVFLPQFGFSGLIMQIYPCLAAGYFILFLMYAAIIFLYYYNDLTGAMTTALSFVAVTFFVSLITLQMPEKWYGLGVTAGAAVGWCIAYFRLRWVERHMDVHVFCNGTIIKTGKGIMLPYKVYDARKNRKRKKEVSEQ